MPLSSMVAGASPAMSSATKMPCWKPRWASCRPGHDVADGVGLLEVGAQALVGEHEAALHRHALLVVAEPVGRRPAPDRHQQQLGLQDVAALDRDGDAGVGGLDALEGRPGAERDAALAERALQDLGRRLVLGRDQPGERLDDGDLGAEGAPDARELHADDPAPEDDDRRRHPVEAQRLLGGDDALAVDLEAGQAARVGAGGQDEVLAGVRVAPTVTWRGPVIRPWPSMTVMPRDLIRPARPLKSRPTTPSL